MNRSTLTFAGGASSLSAAVVAVVSTSRAAVVPPSSPLSSPQAAMPRKEPISSTTKAVLTMALEDVSAERSRPHRSGGAGDQVGGPDSGDARDQCELEKVPYGLVDLVVAELAPLQLSDMSEAMTAWRLIDHEVDRTSPEGWPFGHRDRGRYDSAIQMLSKAVVHSGGEVSFANGLHITSDPRECRGQLALGDPRQGGCDRVPAHGTRASTAASPSRPRRPVSGLGSRRSRSGRYQLPRACADPFRRHRAWFLAPNPPSASRAA
jgi:hypothetical protein